MPTRNSSLMIPSATGTVQGPQGPMGPAGPGGPQGAPAPNDSWWTPVLYPVAGLYRAYVRWIAGGSMWQLTGAYIPGTTIPPNTFVAIGWSPGDVRPLGVRQFQPCRMLTAASQNSVAMVCINWSQVGLIEIFTLTESGGYFYFEPATFSGYSIA